MAALNDQPGIITPYSSVAPFFQETPSSVPEEHRERLSAYDVYEKIYWSVPRTFRLSMRGTNDQPIYVPNARAIVNETAHYLLKGMSIHTLEASEKGNPDKNEGSLDFALDAFLKR